MNLLEFIGQGRRSVTRHTGQYKTKKTKYIYVSSGIRSRGPTVPGVQDRTKL
jgi:hypothetical protein